MARRSFGTIGRRKGMDGWWIRYRDATGRRRLCKGGATIADAEALLEEKRVEVEVARAGAVVALPLGLFLETYLPGLSLRVAPTTYVTQKSRLDRAQAWFDATPIPDIGFPEAEAYLANLSAAGLQASTLRTDKHVLSACWESAIAHGVADVNPWRAVKTARPPEKVYPYLSENKIARLYAACDPRVAPIVQLLGETGLRWSEARDLAWLDVANDFDQLTVRGKGGRVREVYLTALAQGVLHDLHAARTPAPMRGSHYVFPAQQRSRLTVRRWLMRAAADVGLTHITQHSLRHAWASRAVRGGAPIPDVAKHLGHSDGGVLVLRRYGKWAPSNALALLRDRMETQREQARESRSPGDSAGRSASAD